MDNDKPIGKLFYKVITTVRRARRTRKAIKQALKGIEQANAAKRAYIRSYSSRCSSGKV